MEEPLSAERLAALRAVAVEERLPNMLSLIDEVERLRAALGEQRHIVDVAETEFGLQHPVECRPDLLGCAVGKALNALDGPPMPVGRYVVELGPDGLSFAALTPPEPPESSGQ